ncbi:porin family protein [Mongoliibacter ruber]|uniref:Outer membrane protein with beta-barrel domain n=1 Tax=Mongoliibacter ruber TaxID=1750599 RepID=A0A2T0WHH2_9BACT|nr:porin family protein [Mongoliibacter ruber]PRY86158.1 outer membrane protein with beta-barrel domain [Mongoliibacter ruber]
MKRLSLILLLNFVSLTLLFAQEEKRERTPIGGRPDIKGDLFIDFGFNRLNNIPDELGTNFFGSRTFNAYFHYPVNIGNQTGFTFNPGIGIGTDKMAFRDNRNLFNNPAIGPESSQMLELEEVYGEDISVNRNNASANYIDLPLEVRYHFNKRNYSKSFRIALGGKVGYLLNAQTKVQYTDDQDLTRKIKDRQSFGFSPLRYGVYTRIGFPGFNIWGYYGLNQVFEGENGPFRTQANQINFGISATLF